MVRPVSQFCAGIWCSMYACCLCWSVCEQRTLAAVPRADLVKVVAPKSSCAAVDDQRDLLILGERGPTDGQLLIYKLDAANGKVPAGEPTRVPLPRRDPVKAYPNYPLSIVVHPRLPLVYVWQDFTGPQAIAHELDHLVVFSIAGRDLKQVGTFAWGKEFGWARTTGALGIDPAGKRLFLPNLRDPESSLAALGFFDLDDAGMPAPVPVPIAGSLDGFGLDKFEMQLRATRLVIAADASFPVLSAGFVVPSPAVALFGGVSGPAMWDTENRRAALDFVHVPLAGPSTLLGGHPKLPVVYGVSPDDGRKLVFRMRQADGYPTLVPTTISLDDATGFRAAPLVLWGKKPSLAIGGANRLYLVGLDDSGGFTGEHATLEVNNKSVTALAYSEKHGLLYVAVEKIP